jgi:hypothetical protein
LFLKTPFFVHFAKFGSSVGGIVSEWPTHLGVERLSEFQSVRRHSFVSGRYGSFARNVFISRSTSTSFDKKM